MLNRMTESSIDRFIEVDKVQLESYYYLSFSLFSTKRIFQSSECAIFYRVADTPQSGRFER